MALTRDELVAMVAELGPTMEERAFTYDREATFPLENFRDFHDRGLLALCVPTATAASAPASPTTCGCRRRSAATAVRPR